MSLPRELEQAIVSTVKELSQPDDLSTAIVNLLTIVGDQTAEEYERNDVLLKCIDLVVPAPKTGEN